MIAMLTLRPTAQQIERAKAREAAMTAVILERHGREYLDNSIREGAGVLIGLLGEELVKDFYPGFFPSTGKDIYDYDLVDPHWLGTIDVKTKSCTSKPRGYYWATVSDANIKQQCDYYCFVRILEDLSVGWLLGYLPKDLFLDQALFFERGTVDPLSKSGWQFSWDCHNVAIQDLWSPPMTVDGLEYLTRREHARRSIVHV